MNIAVVGADFKSTPLPFRELIYFDSFKIESFYAYLKKTRLVDECVIVSTCNRVEVYFVVDKIDTVIPKFLDVLANFHNVSVGKLTQEAWVLSGNDAISHLFQVACGTESMVLGEGEILAQIRESYHHALEVGQTGAILNKLFQIGIGLGKKARLETTISKGAHSVSSIAVDKIRELRETFFSDNILLIGAGTMVERALYKLKALGHTKLTVANRTEDNAKALAAKFDIAHLPLKAAIHRLADYDVIVTATAATHFLIQTEQFEYRREGCHYLIIDLGMPRNVDPKVDYLPGVSVFPVDGLLEIANNNIEIRTRALAPIEALIEAEISNLQNWHRLRQTQCLTPSV